MTRASIPGAARIEIFAARLPAIRDIVLASRDEELMIDAVLDTGSTHGVISRRRASRLGFTSENRLGILRIRGIGGYVTTMDRHRFEYVLVGSARAYDVDFLVGEALSKSMLLGMSFIRNFTTTLDLDAKSVIFRPRTADR